MTETTGRTDQAKETAQQAVGQATDKMAQGAQQAKDQVVQSGQQAKERARGQIGQQLDQRSTQAGEQVTSVADAMRTTSNSLRDQGKDQPAQLMERVASQADKLGGYLTQANGESLLNDIERMARRQPWVVALGGFTVGLLASRFVKASSERRYEQGSSSYEGTQAWQTADIEYPVPAGVGTAAAAPRDPLADGWTDDRPSTTTY